MIPIKNSDIRLVRDLTLERQSLGQQLAASVAKEAEMRVALELAEIWLCNCVPIVEPTEQKPLPVIRASLSSAPSPLLEAVREAIEACGEVISPNSGINTRALKALTALRRFVDPTKLPS